MHATRSGHTHPYPVPSAVTEVLRLVLYYDVFSHPLTRAELLRFLGGSTDALDASIDAAAADGLVGVEGRWVFAPGQLATVARRQQRSRQAERIWPAAYRSAALLARFPFVRGVLVTGGMSKNAVGEDADVDFLLLVEPERVWITKSWLQAWRRALPYTLRECFCTNYLLSVDQLDIDEHNMFTAMELATAVPMFGPDECGALLSHNAEWARRYVPNWDWVLQRATHTPSRPASPAGPVERTVSRVPGLEARALDFWDRYWNRKYGWLPEERRSQRFKRRPGIATNHLNDFQGWVLREWTQRCSERGIECP